MTLKTFNIFQQMGAGDIYPPVITSFKFLPSRIDASANSVTVTTIFNFTGMHMTFKPNYRYLMFFYVGGVSGVNTCSAVFRFLRLMIVSFL